MTVPIRDGWWGMACWNALSETQQRELIDEGRLEIGSRPEGDGCSSGAECTVETMYDEAPGPRFYCLSCAADFLLGMEARDVDAAEDVADESAS